MIEKFKKTLVETFVGAIALGWLFAQTFIHFANVFSAPITMWLSRKLFLGTTLRSQVQDRFMWQDGLPELVKFIVLLVIGILLLRWLYMAPVTSSPLPAEESEVES